MACPTTDVLVELERSGFTNVWGIDCSPAMVERARSVSSRVRVAESIPDDLHGARLVLLHWAPHRPMTCPQRLKDAVDALAPGGALIVTDEVARDDVVQHLYRQFRLSRGLSVEEVAAQDEARGLGPEEARTLQQYVDLVTALGCRPSAVLNASSGFLTLLAYKPRVGHESTREDGGRRAIDDRGT